MVVQQELVHLEVEKLVSIGYANNIQKEAINTASFSDRIVNGSPKFRTDERGHEL